MLPSIPDHIPTSDPPTTTTGVPSPRGGRRTGAGAPRGNLNALKHGRYSRFRDMIAPQPVTAAAARRLITREQRAAERHAANLLVLARHARYQADYAAAITEGRALPPPPLVSLRDLDFPALKRLLSELAGHAVQERARRAGLLTADSAALAGQRRFVEGIGEVLPHAIAALDRVAAAALSPADLAALLAPPAAGDKPGLNQRSIPPRESAATPQSSDPDSQRTGGKRTTSIDAVAAHAAGQPRGHAVSRRPIRRTDASATPRGLSRRTARPGRPPHPATPPA
jgi:hypothetical protein